MSNHVNKVALIFCYRNTLGQDRDKQLQSSIDHFSHLFRHYSLDCDIIVGEHIEDGNMFNRSAALNAGALVA